MIKTDVGRRLILEHHTLRACRQSKTTKYPASIRHASEPIFETKSFQISSTSANQQSAIVCEKVFSDKAMADKCA